MIRVIQTIQAPDNEPVDIPWYRGDNAAKAIASLADIVADPATEYYQTLTVRVDFS